MDAVAHRYFRPEEWTLGAHLRGVRQGSSSSGFAAGGHGPLGSGERRFLSENNLNSIFSGKCLRRRRGDRHVHGIIAGHIDVSVGSLIGVLATISGTLAVRGYPIWVAWLASIVAGIAIQAVQRRARRLCANPSHRRDPGPCSRS